MYRIIALLTAAAALWVACEDKSVDSDGAEVWKGELALQRYTTANPWLVPDTDLVTFTVEGSLYELTHTFNESRICDSRGRVRNFGRNIMTFDEVTAVYDGSCDTTRVPKGEFDAVFQGDSLFIGPKKVGFGPADSIVYYFRLKLQR